MPHRHNHTADPEDYLIMYPDPPHAAFSVSGNMDHLAPSPDAYYPRHPDFQPVTMAFDSHTLYSEPVGVHSYAANPGLSPSMYPEDACASGLGLPSSTTSLESAPSSAVGSPRSAHGQPQSIPDWGAHSNLIPGIVGNNEFYSTADYSYSTGSTPVMEDFAAFEYSQQPHTKSGFVDTSLIHPAISRPMEFATYETSYPPPSAPAPASAYPTSPGLMTGSPQHRNGSVSPLPYLSTASGYHHHHHHHQAPQHQTYAQFSAPMEPRRQSIHSFVPPAFSAVPDPSMYTGDEAAKEKQRCPHPECGKIFKDLKAHMLTHQTERPEKCPIQTCEYHVKGFARKYDKNRHTLTHYKGNMVCGFCPGSGSAAKSFNRADVFKRHLTAVHGVEQTPPNSRKKSGSASSAKKLSSYAPDATGKCSTCSATFNNAQEFYEHLDDCVLRIVQQEDPAEAINAKRMAEVAEDKDVRSTLEKNKVPTPTTAATTTVTLSDEEENDDDEDMIDAEDLPCSPTGSTMAPRPARTSRAGMTSSRIGITPPHNSSTRRRKAARRDYPPSWGLDSRGQTMLKKRSVVAFDGPRRLVKDEFWVPTDREVRLGPLDGNSYITDVDVRTLERAEAFLNATDAEKGPWDPVGHMPEQMLVQGL